MISSIGRLTLALAALAILLPISAYADQGGQSPLKEGNTMQKSNVKPRTMELKSTAFKNGENIPQIYTCDGQNISPPLSWSGVPPGTKELALIVEDPDAPSGLFIHWVLHGLRPDTTAFPEKLPKKETANGVRQGRNNFGKVGYDGPCPPKGPAHRYFFYLFALDKALDPRPGPTRGELLNAIEGHELARAELMGLYKRR
jgi:hypothetical protein